MKQVESCFPFLRELGGKPKRLKRVLVEVHRTQNFLELGHLVPFDESSQANSSAGPDALALLLGVTTYTSGGIVWKTVSPLVWRVTEFVK